MSHSPPTNPASPIPPAVDGIASRWTILVEACLQGQLMPFLGAGLSIGATLQSAVRPKRYGATMPSTKELTKSILADLKLDLIRLKMEDWSQRELQRIAKQDPPSFADAAQLFIDLHPDGERGLYSSEAPLDIRLFLGIGPTPAHRYIAWLIREGLFSEVISTNYDCALEQAFTDSFSESAAPRVSSTAAPCRPISSHLDYRKWAHVGQRLRQGVPIPVLRIYKINGCAAAYSRHAPTLPEGFIVITERHLQDFGRRQWAQDLFRDRFRCRKIVFSGFGAEEPQVRFTALRVIEEFSQKNDATDSHCFLHTYGADLSASQLQIAKASVPRRADGRPYPVPAVFSGLDKAWFGVPDDVGGLTAAIFWAKLFESVIPRVIARRLERCLVFAWLRQHDGRRPLSLSVAHALREKIAPSDSLPGSISPWLRPFFAVPGADHPTLFLMQLAWRVRQSGTGGLPLPLGYYEECDRIDSIPLMLLYVFHLLGLGAEDVKVGDDHVGFWLRLPIPTSLGPPHINPSRWILVAERDPGRMPTPPSAESRVAVCLMLQKSDANTDDRRPSLTNALAVTWRVISLAELIEAAACESIARPVVERFRLALLRGASVSAQSHFSRTDQAS